MVVDYNNIDKCEAHPKAAPLMQTYRSIGYCLETAMADIIDNSISAGANNIWINCSWNGDNTTISIKDDGCGMNGDEAINAMTLGLINPLDKRSEKDLGRFGLGLKTASFSQCKKLSLFTKKENFHSLYWTWDLDYVAETNNWQLLRWMPEGYANSLDDIEHGTVVIWSELDQLIPIGSERTNEKAKRKFYDSWDKARSHVSMVFHRFIANGLKIYWASHEIEGWDPFFDYEPKTQPKPEESFYLNGKKMMMKGYILPKRKDFTNEEEYDKAEGQKGFAGQQGFYVYRGDRLLVAGDWLGMFKPKDSTKLARISVDLPNTTDTEWLINIMKSTATPPPQLRDGMKSYARNIRNLAEEVYKTRGPYRKRKKTDDLQRFQPLWNEITKGNEWSFVINRENQLIKEIKEMAKESPEKAMDTLFKIVETTLPVQKIYIHEADDNEIQKDTLNDIDMDLISKLLKEVFDNYLSQGFSKETAKNLLRNTEPFNNYEPIIDEL